VEQPTRHRIWPERVGPGTRLQTSRTVPQDCGPPSGSPRETRSSLRAGLRVCWARALARTAPLDPKHRVRGVLAKRKTLCLCAGVSMMACPSATSLRLCCVLGGCSVPGDSGCQNLQTQERCDLEGTVSADGTVTAQAAGIQSRRCDMVDGLHVDGGGDWLVVQDFKSQETAHGTRNLPARRRGPAPLDPVQRSKESKQIPQSIAAKFTSVLSGKKDTQRPLFQWRDWWIVCYYQTKWLPAHP
jgi:hypothetical protein